LENLVFIELKRRKNKLFYNRDKYDCDFLVQEKDRIVCADANFDKKPSTKQAAQLLASIGLEHKKILLFLASGDTVSYASFRNLANVNIVYFDHPNSFTAIEVNFLSSMYICIIKTFHIITAIISISLFSCSADDERSIETPLPQLKIANAELLEGDENRIMMFEVSLSGQVEKNVTVEFSTIDGTAYSGSDFVAIDNGTLFYGTGQDLQLIQVEIIGDLVREGDEVFQVYLQNAENAIIARSKADGKIINDDVQQVEFDVNIPDSGYISPVSYDGMTLIWADEFHGTKLNFEDWAHEIGDGCPDNCGWGNNEFL